MPENSLKTNDSYLKYVQVRGRINGNSVQKSLAEGKNGHINFEISEEKVISSPIRLEDYELPDSYRIPKTEKNIDILKQLSDSEVIIYISHSPNNGYSSDERVWKKTNTEQSGLVGIVEQIIPQKAIELDK